MRKTYGDRPVFAGNSFSVALFFFGEGLSLVEQSQFLQHGLGETRMKKKKSKNKFRKAAQKALDNIQFSPEELAKIETILK